MINHRDACRMRYDELVSMLIESLVLPTKLSEVLEMLKFGSKPSQPIGDHSHFLAMSFSSKRTFWPSLIWLSCAMTIVSCEASLIAWLRYAKPGVASWNQHCHWPWPGRCVELCRKIGRTEGRHHSWDKYSGTNTLGLSLSLLLLFYAFWIMMCL